jgi:hypothetical protein
MSCAWGIAGRTTSLCTGWQAWAWTGSCARLVFGKELGSEIGLGEILVVHIL